MQSGFASEDITPPVGADLPGGFKKNPNVGIRDPLYAVAAVFSDGTNHVAVVGTDTLCIMKETVAQARELIAKATPIPAANVLIGSSHTHTGGPIRWPLEGDDEEFRAYADKVARGIAAAVTRAWTERKRAEIGLGTGREELISFNRRFVMRDGKTITHPGKPGSKHHDEIVRPEGPIDPDVGVLAVRPYVSPVAPPPIRPYLGIIIDFSCHATVMSDDQVSADYPGALRRHLQAKYGAETPVLFLQGACGDITQVDNLSPARQGGWEHNELMGMKLAAEAIRVIGRMTFTGDATVAAATETVPLRVREDPDAERERPPFGLGSGPEEFFAKEREIVAGWRAKEPVHPAEVQALRLGPLGIVTNGTEFFVDLGLRVKQGSPFKSTWISELTNEWLGYVPTANAFSAGGYEPRTRRGSRFDIHSGQLLVEGMLKALNRVKP